MTNNDITVFFAWQADRPARVTRNLIRDATKIACERLTDQNAGGCSFSIDEATQGVPGMCDIPNVILEKISNSHVFLGDLTFVGQALPCDGEAPKLVANPNVLFELGYAARAIGFERILAVMNTAYGAPDSQMFDVKRRWALRYELNEDCNDAERKAVKAELAANIEESLRIIAEKALPKPQREDPVSRFTGMRSHFEDDLREGSFANLEPCSSTLAICLAPDIPRCIDHSQLQSAILQPLCLVDGWDHSYTGNSIVWFFAHTDEAGQAHRLCVSEVTTEGNVFAANATLLGRKSNRLPSGTGKFIPSRSLEETIIVWLLRAAPCFRTLGLQFPWRVGISLLGVKGHHFLAGSDQMSQTPFGKRDLVLNPFTIESAEQVSTGQRVAELLRPTFDFVWREFGYPRALSYQNDGLWDPRY